MFSDKTENMQNTGLEGACVQTNKIAKCGKDYILLKNIKKINNPLELPVRAYACPNNDNGPGDQQSSSLYAASSQFGNEMISYTVKSFSDTPLCVYNGIEYIQTQPPKPIYFKLNSRGQEYDVRHLGSNTNITVYK
jgi:hypothetical protein